MRNNRQKFFVDYHFHPSFNFNKSLKDQAEHLWKKFFSHQLDALIVTEHSYKKPEQSYQILKLYQPENSKIELFPGVEVITREGIDIVVFAKEAEDIYCHPELITPFFLTIEELIQLVENNSKLYSFVTHAFTTATTSIVDHKGINFTLEAIERLKALEVSNRGFDYLLNIYNKTPLKNFFPQKYLRMKQTQNFPLEYQSTEVDFYAIGSDSHGGKQMGKGSLLKVQAKAVDREKLFQAIVNNKEPEYYETTEKRGVFLIFDILILWKIRGSEFLNKKW